MTDWAKSNSGVAAALEVRVAITGSGKQRVCRTDWILHIRERDGRKRAINIAQREDSPDDNEWIEENSFEINAWSSDGRMVLISEIQAQGDWDETTLIIYDFESGHYWRVELYPLFKAMLPKDCYVVYRPVRFDENGQAIISAMSTDDDREEGTPACFPESLWQLDFRNGVIGRLTQAK
jgi:hypothetical protein